MMPELTFALVAPPLLLMKLIITLSWPTVLGLGALVVLVTGAALLLNDHNPAVRWLLLPLLLVHLQIYAGVQFGALAGWAALVLVAAAIGWMAWRCRETPVGAAFLGAFCLFYAGMGVYLVNVGL